MHQQKMRLCCDNCGAVNDYEVKYKSTFVSYDDEDSDMDISHFIEFASKRAQVLICFNCGIPKLALVYWPADETKSRDPLSPIRRTN
jgi:hypothetical protein